MAVVSRHSDKSFLLNLNTKTGSIIATRSFFPSKYAPTVPVLMKLTFNDMFKIISHELICFYREGLYLTLLGNGLCGTAAARVNHVS